MKDFLRSIKLVREFSVTLNCPKAYFMKALGANTKAPGIELFEAFTSGPPFKGTVGEDQFRIRQRQQGFNSTRQYMVKANGVVVERNDQTVIAIEANGFNWFLGVFWGLFVFFFIGVFISMLLGPGFPMFVIPILVLQMGIFFLVPYFIVRKTVANVEREFSKEFYFIVRDYKA